MRATRISTYYLLGKDVRPCGDLRFWGQTFEKCDRNLGKTRIGDILVSSQGKGFFCLRYTDWEDAENGHQDVCRLILSKLLIEEKV